MSRDSRAVHAEYAHFKPCLHGAMLEIYLGSQNLLFTVGFELPISYMQYIDLTEWAIRRDL